jgi:hypothetical protein
MTAEDVEVWLNGTLEETLTLQKPRADEAIVVTPYDEKTERTSAVEHQAIRGVDR